MARLGRSIPIRALTQPAVAAPAEIFGSLDVTLDDATSTASGASGASGALAETLDDATVAAEGTFTDAPAPEPTPLTPSLPQPRPIPGGRIVPITLTANLGTVVAQTSPRIELADEELVELL